MQHRGGLQKCATDVDGIYELGVVEVVLPPELVWFELEPDIAELNAKNLRIAQHEGGERLRCATTRMFSRAVFVATVVGGLRAQMQRPDAEWLALRLAVGGRGPHCHRQRALWQHMALQSLHRGSTGCRVLLGCAMQLAMGLLRQHLPNVSSGQRWC